MPAADRPSSPTDAADVTAALAAPFDPSEVKWKPGVVSGNRALALAYTDCRTIQDRLDDVLGVAGWQDAYKVLPDGSVVCRLRCLIAGQWIVKTDVGGQSEQPDGGDRCKSAFSDALKRAAVKFGVGRYLYRLPAQWCDYDPQKRAFKATPTVPDWARPAAAAKGKAKDTAPIGDEAGRRLQELADRKGQRLQSWLEPHLDRAAFTALRDVPTWAARLAWKALEKLPDVKPTNGHAAPAEATAAAPVATKRLPF